MYKFDVINSLDIIVAQFFVAVLIISIISIYKILVFNDEPIPRPYDSDDSDSEDNEEEMSLERYKNLTVDQ